MLTANNSTSPTSRKTLLLWAVGVSAYLVCGCMAHPKAANGLRYDGCVTTTGAETERPVVHSVKYSPSSLCEAPVAPDRPLTVMDDVRPTFVELSLSDAVSLALNNSQLIQTVVSPGARSTVMTIPDRVASAFDPAIQDSGVLLGQRGVAAALSDFDTQVSASLVWSRDELIQNNTFLSGGVLPGDTLVEETGAHSVQLQRNLRNGASVSVTHDWNYNGSNRSDLLFPSVYTGGAQFQFRQPLWAGRGREVTGVAGPLSSNIQGVSGVSQGIEIAKINTKVSVIDFEIATSALLRDVQTVYWQLYLAHESLEQVRQLTDRIDAIAENVSTRLETGAPGVSVIEVTEVERAKLDSELQLQQQTNAVLQADAQLRRLLRVAGEHQAVYRPIDTPSEAAFVFDWHDLITAAHEMRPELRRQRLRLSQFRKQVAAAQNLARPRLDFVSQYQINGFGDRLFADDGPAGLESGYGRLFKGDETGWTAGVQFSSTVGRRLARTRVQNLQLQLAKATGVLNEQIAEINVELADAIREIDSNRKQMALNRKRVLSHERNRSASAARFDAVGDPASLLTWLRAEQSLMSSRAQQLSSLVGYNAALANLQHRTGRMLQLSNMSICAGTNEVIWHTRSTIRSPEAPESLTEPTPSPLTIRLPPDPI